MQGDRWGQRLQGDITRVVAENLRGLLPSDNVFVLPLRRREPVAMTVAVDITSFERDASGAVVLNAYWTVLDGQTEAERAGHARDTPNRSREKGLRRPWRR